MKKMDVLNAPTNIEFLGEQDGPPEQDLKGKIVPILEDAGDVRAAYLAIADYHDGSPRSVMLCLRSEKGDDRALVDKIGKVVYETVSAGLHLDVFFLTAQKEGELKLVCSPFYTS